MSRYTSMLIDAMLIGFVLFTLIHGTLTQYLAFAAQSAGSGSVPAAPASPATLVSEANNFTMLGAEKLLLQKLNP